MVFEAEQHAWSRWEAICSVEEKLGPTPETVRGRVQRVGIHEEGSAAVSGDRLTPLTAADPNAGRVSAPTSKQWLIGWVIPTVDPTL